MKQLIDKLCRTQALTAEEFLRLLVNRSPETDVYARELACQMRQKVYGNKIYIRGLIEFTSYCRNDCYYCGIRRSNREAQRYRLDEEDILACCDAGYRLGFRTFVLQGGEDAFYQRQDDSADTEDKGRIPGLCADAVCWRKAIGNLPGIPGSGSGQISAASRNGGWRALPEAASAKAVL